MSIQSRNKNTVLTLRMNEKDVGVVKEAAKLYNLKQVQIIEALLHHFESLPPSKQKAIIASYLTKNL